MRRLNFIAALFFFIICGAFCAYILYDAYGLWSIVADVAVFIAFPVSVLLHEAGHMIFGAMVKIKAVPSFHLIKPSFCKIIPKTHRKVRSRLWVTAFGGIFINLLLFVLGLLAIVGTLPVWLCVIAPSSLYLCVLNAVPLQYAEGKTDGMVCWELASGSDWAKVTVSVLTVQAQVLNGIPIEEADENLLFDLPVIQEDDASFISLMELRYEFYKAKGQAELAELYQKRFLELKEQYMPD